MARRYIGLVYIAKDCDDGRKRNCVVEHRHYLEVTMIHHRLWTEAFQRDLPSRGLEETKAD